MKALRRALIVVGTTGHRRLRRRHGLARLPGNAARVRCQAARRFAAGGAVRGSVARSRGGPAPAAVGASHRGGLDAPAVGPLLPRQCVQHRVADEHPSRREAPGARPERPRGGVSRLRRHGRACPRSPVSMSTRGAPTTICAGTLHAEPRRIVVYGWSLGSAVAVDLVSRVDEAAVILEGAPASLVAIGARRYPYFPIRLLIRNPFESILKIGRIGSPVLFLHSPEDAVIPFEEGRKLFDAAPFAEAVRRSLGRARLLQRKGPALLPRGPGLPPGPPLAPVAAMADPHRPLARRCVDARRHAGRDAARARRAGAVRNGRARAADREGGAAAGRATRSTRSKSRCARCRSTRRCRWRAPSRTS